jgi:hypothetical protein
MRNTARQTRENRTLTIDVQNEATYFSSLVLARHFGIPVCRRDEHHMTARRQTLAQSVARWMVTALLRMLDRCDTLRYSARGGENDERIADASA